MIDEERLRLFLYNSAVVHAELRKVVEPTKREARLLEDITSENDVGSYISQFAQRHRQNATFMAPYYALFYMLENEIRGFIKETLHEKASEEWWDTCVPDPVKKEVAHNRDREQDFALNPRSEENLDYTTFGQLGDIMRENWDVFGGVLTSPKAMGRVMTALNALRGPIAHCGVLAPDEADRLILEVKAWFRVLAGPKTS